MVGRALHWISLACCLFVVLAFLLFAHAQVSHASSHQANEVAPRAHTAQTAASPHRRAQGQPGRFIDSIAGKLESPFTSLVSTGNAWVGHLVPLGLALLVYGAGLGFLSRWASGLA
jgi:hypothetical protein